MWPTHCVQNTRGAEFHESVPVESDEIIVSKGMLERVDSYSGFGSPPETTTLKDELTSRGVTEVYCVGLAYDYCVGSTAVDAAKNGFKTYLLTDATKSRVSAKYFIDLFEKINMGKVLIFSLESLFIFC